MVDAVLKLEEGTKFMVLAPVVRQRKGTQQKELEAARRAGYARVKIDGNLYDLDEEITDGLKITFVENMNEVLERALA